MKILDARWIKEEDELELQVIKHNKKVVTVDPKIKPYFFIRLRDYPTVKHYLYRYEVERVDAESVDGDSLVKISVDFPTQVKYLRDKLEAHQCKTYESDIPFVKRWMIDLGITHGDFKNRAYVDIEVDARSGFPNPEEAKARIISISVVFSDGEEYFISKSDEVAMLQEFWDLMMDKAEMVTGWNLRRFDWPYLVNRSKLLLGGVPFTGVQELDAMFNFQKIVRWNAPGLGMKLDDIAYHFLGFRKLDDFEHKDGMIALWNSFQGDKKLLYEYNMRDAKLVAMLDEVLHLSDPYIEISKEFPIMLRDTGYVSDLIEALVLETAQEVQPRVVFPRKEPHKATIIGAITKKPVVGIHRSVAVLDFKSMYNSIIQAFHISPELMKRYTKFNPTPDWNSWGDGIRFIRGYVEFVHRYSREPIFERFLKKVEKKREYAKKMRNKYDEKDPEFIRWQLAQFGFKLILVSAYGATGYSGARYFNEATANAITFCGRWIISTGMQIAEDMGYEVLYGDTDSFFLKKEGTTPNEMAEVIDLLAMKIQDGIRVKALETFKYVDVDKLQLDPKCIYETLLLTKAKKVYWGKIVWEEGHFVEKKDVKGAPMKRSDSFELLRKVQDELTDLFFDFADKDKSVILEVIRSYENRLREELFSGKYDDLLIMRKQVRGNLEDYSVNQPHVRVARKLQEMGAYRPGDAVRWIVVREGNEEPVIGDKIPKPTPSGYAYYWKRIKDCIKRMLEALATKEVTLYDFM